MNLLDARRIVWVDSPDPFALIPRLPQSVATNVSYAYVPLLFVRPRRFSMQMFTFCSYLFI